MRRSAGDSTRRQLAQAQAWAAQPADPAVPCGGAGRSQRPHQVRAYLLGASKPARDVVADVGHGGRTRLRRKHRVEGGDAIRLGGRHGQALADVVQAGLRDLADAILEGMECGEKEIPSSARRVSAARHVPVEAGVPIAPGPAGFGGTDHRIHGGALSRQGEGSDDVEIHRDRV